MTRIENWEIALDKIVRERLRAPFEWGVQDCCAFAADVVLAITGADPMAELRGYADEEEARATLEREGWSGVFRAMQKVLGRSVPVSMAQRGDVVYSRLDGGTFSINSGAGICLGALSAFPGDSGLVMLPTSSATRAWPIGRTPPKKKRS